MTVAIVGASGFVGNNLVTYLLKNSNYHINALCRTPYDIQVDPTYEKRVSRIKADVFDLNGMTEGLKGSAVAVYLVHMMDSKGDYYSLEAKAAHNFGHAAKANNLKRVVFMGGLGNDNDQLSKHLRSRHNTGQILRKYVPILIEFRASMIIGDGSIAYEIVKSLVHKLPVQTVPSWAITKTQPIALVDALKYINASLQVPINKSEIVEIGGPEKLSYKDLIIRYGSICGRKPIIIMVPIVPLWLGAWWLNLFTPARHAKVGRQMAESLKYPMVVTTNKAEVLFPMIKPESIDKAFIDANKPV